MRAYIMLLLAVVVAVHGASWKIVDKNVATIDLGVSFISEKVGYTAGTMNGAGPAILKSTDGGVTFSPCNVTSFGADLILLDIDAAGQSIVVSSIFGEIYSKDGGNTFDLSRGGGDSQSVRHIGANGDGGHKFACAGQYPLRKANGVAISLNDGKNFAVYDAGLAGQAVPARYGAYPSDSAWYVSAGQWPPPPPSPPAAPQALRLKRKSRVLSDEGKVVYRPQAWRHLLPNTTTAARKVGDDQGYTAQITKSADSGKTWVSLFAENNTFYFNGIDCSPTNPDHCCAVGEGFADPPPEEGSKEPGGRIHCTVDGGKTWTRNFWAPEGSTNATSLMEIRFTSDLEIWVCGAVIKNSETPLFLHSVDGGKTWASDVETLQFGALAVSLSFPDVTGAPVGFAVLMNTITQSSSIAKYS